MEDLNIWLKSIGCIAAVVTAAVAILQWRRSLLIKRAEFVDKIFTRFNTDENIRKMFYFLEFHQDWDVGTLFQARARTENYEEWIDIGLTYFSYVLHLREMGVLREKDFVLFRYMICRIIANRGIQNYLYNLYHFAKANQLQFIYPVLLSFADSEKLLKEGFYDVSSCRNKDMIFHRYLNF